MSLGRLWLLTCFGICLLSGCTSTESVTGHKKPELEASPYQKIGKIVSHDPSSATVVVRLDRKGTFLTGELLVRNTRLEVIALLRPTGIRTGNSVGMVVIRGEPESGQEVVQMESR